jgi:glycoside/pentoside/hexuronide:cation symporter, GPH family
MTPVPPAQASIDTAQPSEGHSASPTPPPTAPRLASYGAFALPLAFAALPLYVQWPAHAASAWGLPLAAIGALLLAVRVGDAFIDPWIGARIDTLFARSPRHAWLGAGVAAACIAIGMAALMFAPPGVAADTTALLAWAAAALVLTSLGYSVATVTHQAWAVRLGGGTAEQARWVGTREALALAGVIVASLLPALLGWAVTVAVLAMLLLLAWLMLSGVLPPRGAGGVTPRLEGAAAVSSPAPGTAAIAAQRDARSPWRDAGFRRLMPVVLASGLASAIPASLVVLYVRDLLQAGAAAEGWVLGLYFAAAAGAMPLWVRAVRRYGLLRPWFAGMWIAIAAFAGAAALGPGDIALFAVICIASGLALGADLVVPPALLAGLIQRRASGGSARPGSGEDTPGL